MCTYLEN